MTVYEIPNIEHCDVTEVAGGRMFGIVAHEGWYIHLNDGDESTANVYKGAVILRADRDFSTVEIVPESELPEDAEILGAGDFAFMQKAQQRVMSLVEQARIVVFATHDWGAAQSFCTRGLVFEKGRVIFDGAISEAIEAYKISLEKQQDA